MSAYVILILKIKQYLKLSQTEAEKCQIKVRGVLFDGIKTTIEIVLITKLFRFSDDAADNKEDQRQVA